MLYLRLFLSAFLALVAASNEEGLKFLEENKKKEGVITLPSGMQYKVLNKGTGKQHPLVSTPCSCHYEGTLIGPVSYAQAVPTEFAPNQVIKGWTEAMQLMVEGDKWEMYIPSELAYGEGGSPPKIPGGSVLIFKMEIVSINGPGKKMKKMKEKAKGDLVAERVRLQGMFDENEKTKNLSKKNREWLESRLLILKKMVPEGGKEEL